MKKINRLTLVLTLMAAGLFAGCASDEEATRENQKIALDGSHFKFTEVAYQADQAVTRAAASVKPMTVDLGDGLEAEVSVTPDAPTGKTRAVDPISDGKYTILAFDPTTHDLQGKLEGSVTSGVFTPDAGQKLLLYPGTYDFTCFSEPVEYDEPNNRLVVHNGLKSPTIGHVQATIVGDDYEVVFNMEHKAIRVRFKITSDILSENTPIDAYLEGSVFGPWYWVHDWYTAYSGVLNNTGNGDFGGGSLNFNTVAPVTTQAGTTYTSDYVYMLQGVSSHDNLSTYAIYFNAGTIGGAPLAGKTVGLNAPPQWTNNQSITINVNVKGQLYLFEDGKARVLAGKGTHTPIGLVIQQKWGDKEGTACGLTRVGSFSSYDVIGNSTVESNVTPSPASFEEAAKDMNGYQWTYSPDLQGNVRANDPINNTVFYKVARYSPGVSVASNVGKWYLPALGELVKLIQLFDKSYTPKNAEIWSGRYTGFTAKFKKAFQAANPSTDFSGNVWPTSTQMKLGSSYPYTYFGIWDSEAVVFGSDGTGWDSRVLVPFVHYK